MSRWNKAQTAKEPLQIVTQADALNASKVKTNANKKHGFIKQIMLEILHGQVHAALHGMLCPLK
jgi:porphobilinogen deaminase